jgi:hypothetical protein
MTQPTLLELAKQGDEEAIASVINHLLKDKGIAAKAVQKDDCLIVILVSDQAPEQTSSVEFIHKLMMKLEIKSIKSVRVYGKQAGQPSSAWMKTLSLTSKLEEQKKQTISSETPQQSKIQAIIDRWPIWFPYPSSWVRALILVPFAFPGTRLIVFGLGGVIVSALTNSPELLIFFVVFGLLLPTIILSFLYHFFWFIWKKRPSSNRWTKWVPGSSSLWEGFYATVVIGLSFLAILAVIAALAFLSCKLSHATAEEIGGCMGRATGRAAGAMFGTSENAWDFSGRGVVTWEQDDFAVKPWFVIWLIIASYLYQTEYLIRHRVVPKLKVTLENYQSGRSASRQKPQKLVKKLLIILLIPLVAVGIYLFSRLPELKETIPVAIDSQSPSVTPTPIASTSSATSSPQHDFFGEAVNKAMSAATITQSATSKDDWNLVASQWQEAIALMKAVPGASPNYALAQKKVVEYQPNLEYALSAANRAK